MLVRVDKTLAVVSWIAAAVLVLMLFIGPEVIAEDEATPGRKAAAGAAPYGGDAGADGKALFSDNCGSCHTLTAAGTSGQVGPNLDDTSLDAGLIEDIVRDGQGTMPAFGDQLSDAEVTAVANYVVDSGSP